MSFMLLGILNSQAGGQIFDYWLATLGGSGSSYGNEAAIDSAGNSYGVAITNAAGEGNFDLLFVKYDPSGTLQWQRTLGGVASDRSYAITLDLSDNVYIAGQTNSTGEGSSDLLLVKYNSAGTIQWQRTLGGAAADYGRAVAIDSAGNVYLFGYTSSAGTGVQSLLLAKYNSSGTIQWQKTLGGSGQDIAYEIAIDSSDNVYAVGRTNSVNSSYFVSLLAKFDSAGNLQWQRTIQEMNPASVAIDSNNNVYMVGISVDAGGSWDFLLVKYNSSGTIQWQRTFGGAGSDQANKISIDSADNVYILGFTNGAGEGANDLLFAKYSSTGTIQWQRVLGGVEGDVGQSMAFDSVDNVHLFGNTGNYPNEKLLLAKLPNDGSLTGTYTLDGVSIVYATSSLTTATPTLTTAATSSLTVATSSLTAATSTLTDASASLTGNFVGIG
jgi:uncharacterized delta-60 repeat protein